jgi:hypothetical protein
MTRVTLYGKVFLREMLIRFVPAISYRPPPKEYKRLRQLNQDSTFIQEPNTNAE